jgi:hypothetical protein
MEAGEDVAAAVAEAEREEEEGRLVPVTQQQQIVI